MLDYSIEQNAEKIYHAKTKEYFQEVLQSYINGSYRSAIVMLYSVVVCDLVYKLKDLKNIYDDQIATDILKKMKEEQMKNPRSGDWEKALIEEVGERTYLLESSDRIELDRLREHRHLCAHPVLTNQDLLSTPNKETVRALIRNMLEGLLVKNPVMSRKVFQSILEDLAKNKGNFLDERILEEYLESKYLRNTNEQLINNVFKDLWNITFNCVSAECAKNRKINYRALKIIFKKYRANILDYVRNNTALFNKINLEDDKILLVLCEFYGDYPMFFDYLEEHNKVQLKNKVKGQWTAIIRSPFLKNSMEEYFQYLINNLHQKRKTKSSGYNDEVCEINYDLKRDDQDILFKWSEENECTDLYYELLIQQFIHSESFNKADSNYVRFIEKNIKHFSEKHFIILLEGINDNFQCYGRNLAKQNNSEIKEFADLILGKDFNYMERYPKIEFMDQNEN